MICNEKDIDGRARVTADEERVLLLRNWPFPDCALGSARFLFLLQVQNSRQHAEIFD